MFENLFLSKVNDLFPEIFGWVQFSYHTGAELRFGILSTTGVQQGDPLGPLIFSLVLIDLLNSINIPSDIPLQLWYLDDGTIVGPRKSVASILNQISSQGPSLGLHVNTAKSEVYIYWPTGDNSFPEFPQDISKPKEGITLLGSPLWGEPEFFAQVVQDKIQKVLDLHTIISSMEDAQIELHLLRSCLGCCKITHLLRTGTVPLDLIQDQVILFDQSLRHTLSTILHCSINDQSWAQASLPFRLGGLGIRRALDSASAAYLSSTFHSKILACSSLYIVPNV